MLDEIYKVRFRRDIARHAPCKDQLTQLRQYFLDRGYLAEEAARAITCPYTLDFPSYVLYINDNWELIKEGVQNSSKANVNKLIEAHPTDWLYRICRLQSVIMNTGSGEGSMIEGFVSGWPRPDDIANSRDTALSNSEYAIEVLKKAFEQSLREHNRDIVDVYTNPELWLRLDEYATGYLMGEAGFTWWTAEPIPPEDIVEARLKMGLTMSQVPAYQWDPEQEPVDLVILACPIDYALRRRVALVPNAVAGHVNMIFDAQHPNAMYGRTIDLRKLGNGPLEEGTGVPEVLLGSVPVSQVYLLPVWGAQMNRANRKNVSSGDPRLHQPLLEFYQRSTPEE